MPWDPHSIKYAESEENCVDSVRTQDRELQLDAPDQPEADNLNHHVCFIHSYFNSREITGIINESDDFMNHLTDTVMQNRPKTSQNLEGLTACLICQINVAADDLTGDGINGMKDITLYPLTEDMRRVKTLLTQEWHSILTPQILSKWWNCTMNAASHMMQSTTQAGICNIYVPGERKLREHFDHMRYLPCQRDICMLADRPCD